MMFNLCASRKNSKSLANQVRELQRTTFQQSCNLGLSLTAISPSCSSPSNPVLNMLRKSMSPWSRKWWRESVMVHSCVVISTDLWTVGLSMIMNIFKCNMIIMGWLWFQYSSGVLIPWPDTFNYHTITIQLQYNMTLVFDHIDCLSIVEEPWQNQWQKVVPAVLNITKPSRPSPWGINYGWK